MKTLYKNYCFTNTVIILISTAAGIFLMLVLLVSDQSEAAVSESISLQVDFSHATPLSLKKYGTNGSLLGVKIGYGSQGLEDIYKQTGIVFTRFPGGTIGNYYHWRTGKFSCNRTSDEQSLKTIADLNRRLERTQTTYSVNDFFDFTQNIGCDFTYVLNSICDSSENNAELLKYMKKRNVELRYVEIGNETSSGRYEWAYGNAKAYLESAKENYFSIKRYYPEAKIGLVVSPISFSGKHDPDEHGKPNKSWPVRAVQFDVDSANASIGDALIIHIYAHPYHKIWEEKPNTERERYIEIMKHFNSKFDISMNYLKALGNGKTIWLTEWGAGVLSTPDMKIQDLFRKYINSAYHGLFVASALVSITLEEGVEIANYHNASNLWRNENQQTEITPVGTVLGLFIDAAKKTNTVFSVLSQPSGSDGKVGEIAQVRGFSILSQPSGSDVKVGEIAQVRGIKALLFTSDNAGDLFVINEQDKLYKINRLDLGIKKFSDYRVDVINIIDNDFRTFMEAEQNIKNIGKVGIEVPPFSILRIRMH